ncbi:NifB/NifX family molybdenum-iron cluster-binding protein [Thiorhodococcus mannitoliphagus]|uniref:NifB/NifX family molybdenum-iron cluster-binding protein n=1 Tax=Thiorhodococcus mannitoliphagus TaxID=329406 RepID=UPI001F10F4DA|nr:NifB/NifX family molybdenum-iron cluster-binding protein [Thiorhodococcus mannitoliphagus]
MADIANPFAEAHEPGQIPTFIRAQGTKVILNGGMGGRAIALFKKAGTKTATDATGRVRASLESHLIGTPAAAAPCTEPLAQGQG